jgi:hypothetical protein
LPQSISTSNASSHPVILSAAAREAILYSIFYELQNSRHKLQLEVLELLSSVLERRPQLMVGCHNLLHLAIHMIELTAISKTISEEMRTAVHTKLFWLIGLIGREHIAVKDLNRLFRLFQRVVERDAPTLLSPLLLTALNDMTFPSSTAPIALIAASATAVANNLAGSTSSSGGTSLSAAIGYTATSASGGPGVFFDFSGASSAMILPRIDTWTPLTAKGYTVCFWVRWEPDEDLPKVPIISSSTPAAATTTTRPTITTPTPNDAAALHASSSLSSLTSLSDDVSNATSALDEPGVAALSLSGQLSPPPPSPLPVAYTPPSSGADSAPSPPYRFLYSLMTSKGHGLELCIGKKVIQKSLSLNR